MPLPKNYYPTYDHGCNPIHAVRDWCYVRKIVRAVRRGEQITPILIDGKKRNGNMLTGTHRSAANDLLNMLGDSARIPLMYVSDLELTEEQQTAIEELDYSALDELFDRTN